MIAHMLCLPPRQQEKVDAALAAIPRKAHSTSLRKFRNLLGMLHSITPDVSGLRVMFKHVQHALKRATGRHVQLTADVHNDLEAWRKLVYTLTRQPTQLRELQPFISTWIGSINALGSGMGGVYQDPEGQYFFWKSPFYLATQARMVSSSNPTGDVTIKNPDLGALLMQLLISSPRMAPLAHIHAYVDNMMAQRWANRGSVSAASSVRTTLWELYLASRRKHIHASTGRVPG